MNVLDALGVRDGVGGQVPGTDCFHSCLQGRGGFGKCYEAEAGHPLGETGSHFRRP